MTPSAIGPRGRDDSARASEGDGGGARSAENVLRPSHPPTRTDVSGPLGGAAQLGASDTVVEKLVDQWLDDLEALLGGVADGDVNPRFVEGVLVEAKRS